MGRKLDLSGLTEDEEEQILQVVRRDMKLRQTEDQRLSGMKQELEEEARRCSLLSRRYRFNEHCCIRCCAPFSFLLNPKRVCLDCRFNVCKKCRSYSKEDQGWLCTTCQKSRALKTRSFEWFYDNVKSRFRWFGSATVLRTLRRRQTADEGVPPEFTGGSTTDESNGTGDSSGDSDSAFYRQNEDNSMPETLTVALRVAEEAIEEAIVKAEGHSDSLEKQNEARYLRDNKEDLIEELATTIAQKIIQRRRRQSEQPETELEWSDPRVSQPSSPALSQHNATASQTATLKATYSLWRARSPQPPTSDEAPSRDTDPELGAVGSDGPQTDVKDYPLPTLSSWKSVDRLDNSILQSPDGNWIALQSTQLSRPTLLTKRKSLVFSALERESGVVSAYDEMGSDTEAEDGGGWSAALQEIRRKMSAAGTQPSGADSENSAPEGPPRLHRTLLSAVKRKVQQRRALPQHPPIPNVGLNPRAMSSSASGDSSEADQDHGDPVRRSRRRRRSRREGTEQAGGRPSEYATVPEYSSFLLSAIVRKNMRAGSPHRLSYPAPDAVTSDTVTSDAFTSGAASPDDGKGPAQGESAGEALEAIDLLELQLNSKLCDLAHQVRNTELSSSEGEPRVGQVLAEREILVHRAEAPGETEMLEEMEGEMAGATEKEMLEEMTGDTLKEAKGERLEEVERDGMVGEPEQEFEKTDGETVLGRQVETERLWEMEGEWTRVKVEAELGAPINRMNQEAGDTEEDELSREEVMAVRNGERLVEKEEKGDGSRPEETEREKENLRDEVRFSDRGVEDGGLRDVVRFGDREEENNVQKETEGTALEEKARKGEEERRGEEEEKAGVGGAVQGGNGLSLEELSAEELRQGGCNGENFEQKLLSLSSLVPQRYSAASLCSLTTEMLKVLNATEELMEEVGGEVRAPPAPAEEAHLPTPGPEAKRLDAQLTKLEENVYLAAGTVYRLESELGDLEENARDISSVTSEKELAHLEDKVATAAAQVQQSELQVTGIAARISALKTAGLNVAPSMQFSKHKPEPKRQTIHTSRHQRRRLPAPPAKDSEAKPSQHVRASQPK